MVFLDKTLGFDQLQQKLWKFKVSHAELGVWTVTRILESTYDPRV